MAWVLLALRTMANALLKNDSGHLGLRIFFLLSIFLTVATPYSAKGALTCASLFSEIGNSKRTGFGDLFERVSPSIQNSRLKLVSQEAWPVEIYEPMDKVGISSNNRGTYRVFTKQVFESGDLQIEVLDSAVASGRPVSFFDELRKIDYREFHFIKIPESAHFPDVKAELDAGADPEYFYNRWGPAFPTEWGRKAEANAIHDGKQKQKKSVDEILNFVFPLYKERRHWTDDFIKSLTKKAYESMDNTRYIIVRKKSTDPSKISPIIATIGVTRVTYGRVRFFNKVTRSWEEYTGAFGNRYIDDNYTGSSGRRYGFSTPDLWLSKPDLLPMEKVFGNEAFLPRPVAKDSLDKETSIASANHFFKNAFSGFSYVDKKAEQGRLRGWVWPSGIEPDLERPIEFSSGQIFEPTKFAVAKDDEMRNSAKQEVLAQLFSAVFPNNNYAANNGASQYLYTYNDHDGTIMYKRMGFKDLTSVQPKVVDGTKWFALGLSPQDLTNQLLNKSQLTEAQAVEIMKRLESSARP